MSTSSTSSLGVLLAEPLPTTVRELLVVIQHELFNLGGELSIPSATSCSRSTPCCAWTRRWRGSTPRCRAWKEFILPAGTRSAALAHVSRTARRAERAVVALAAQANGERGAAPVPQPPVRPAVRAGARSTAPTSTGWAATT